MLVALALITIAAAFGCFVLGLALAGLGMN
jgi:hypothetical protein